MQPPPPCTFFAREFNRSTLYNLDNNSAWVDAHTQNLRVARCEHVPSSLGFAASVCSCQILRGEPYASLGKTTSASAPTMYWKNMTSQEMISTHCAREALNPSFRSALPVDGVVLESVHNPEQIILSLRSEQPADDQHVAAHLYHYGITFFVPA